MSIDPGQLLCACSAAHDIVTAGTLPLTNASVQKAKFTAPPVAFVGGDGNPEINACLVGTAGNLVIVAFRGTLWDFAKISTDWSTFLDWLQDFLAVPVEVDGFPGQVHDGFRNAFATLWPDAASEIKSQMSALGAAAQLCITGHSKGAPLANYAAWMVTQPPFHYAPTCITFAGPRAGDQEFANAYENNESITDTRYEYQDDIVPHVPPSLSLIAALGEIPNLPDRVQKTLDWAADWNYVPVGKLQFIDWNGQIETPTSWLAKARLELDRTLGLVKLIGTCRFKQIVDDHALVGGYCASVCPPRTCG